jgi:low affinity Fe/Cu permease
MYINSIINVDVGKCVEIHIFLVQNLDESIFLIDTILMKEKSEETTTNEQSEDNNRHTTHRKNTNKSKDTTQKLK